MRYVLEGSVRKLGEMLRVNAQLIATETGAHLWADRFDQQLNDLSAGQDAIVRRIGQTLDAALADVESARSKRERPTNPDAFDLIQRARALRLHPMGPREKAQRLALYDQALRLDPTSVSAMTGLVFALGAGDGLERAAKLLADATAIRPNQYSVLAATAFLLYAQGRYTESISAYQRLLSDYPNDDAGYNQIADCLIRTGRAEEAIPMIETAMRLNPRSGFNWNRYENMGFALLMLGRDQESIVWTQRALAANPNGDADDRAQLNVRLAAAHARLESIGRGTSCDLRRRTGFGSFDKPPFVGTGPTTPQVVCTSNKSTVFRQRFALPGSETTPKRTLTSALPRMTDSMRTSPG